MSTLSVCFATVCITSLYFPCDSTSSEMFRTARGTLAPHVEPNGRASVQLAEHEEASRDFTRTLLATSQDILLLSATTDADVVDTMPSGEDDSMASTGGSLDSNGAVAAAGLKLQPVACETKGTGDVNEVKSARS